MVFKGTRPPLKLSENDIEKLTKINNSKTAPFREVERAKIILTYNDLKKIYPVAKKLEIDRPKVERTIDKALVFGVDEALKDLPRKGRNRKISDAARVWLIDIACHKPREYGYASELWTNETLRQHIITNCEEAGYPELSKISGGTISKILNASNIKPHKIKGYIKKRDPHFEEQAKVVLFVYKQIEMVKEASLTSENLQVVFISYDEKPGIQAIGNAHPDLNPVPGKYPSFNRDPEYIRHGTVSLLAGIDLLTGEVHPKVSERHRSKEFIEFLQYLDSIYPNNKTIIIILDNHSAHKSIETQKYLLTKLNRFKFVFTPKHASWLNIIESFFSKMARSFLRGIKVYSKADLEARIYEYFNEINKMPVLFRWKYKMDSTPGDISTCLYCNNNLETQY